jgi:hypothetical protein
MRVAWTAPLLPEALSYAVVAGVAGAPHAYLGTTTAGFPKRSR